MKTLTLFVSMVLLVGYYSSCKPKEPTANYLTHSHTPEEIENIHNKVEKVANLFIGHFSSEEQANAKQSPMYTAQEMIGVPIWPNRNGEHWIAFYRMKKGLIEIPIIQLIFEVKKVNNDTIAIYPYDYPNKPEYATAWLNREKFQNITPQELTLKEDCVIHITRGDSGNEFKCKGIDHCNVNISSKFSYYDFDAVITPDMFTYYLTFYDDNLEEVYNYHDDPLLFKRLDKSAPRYSPDDIK